MATVTICSDFGAPPKWSLSLFPLFPHVFAMKWWDQMLWSLFFECWALSQLFHSPLSLSSRGFLFFFAFCHKGGVIWISEVIDISPGNLYSSLRFFQPSISHDAEFQRIWWPTVPGVATSWTQPKWQHACLHDLNGLFLNSNLRSK